MTIQALRTDVALQVARAVARSGDSQVTAARRLGIPQPTLSRIVRGKLNGISLELLIRIAVRAGCSLVLQTGLRPSEAGAYLSGQGPTDATRTRSGISDWARDALTNNLRSMTPDQRLEAQLEHSRLVIALHRAGRRRRR